MYPRILVPKGANERRIQSVARSTRRQLFGLSSAESDARSWDGAIASFQARRMELDAAESQLYANYGLASQDETDLAEWQRLFNRVNAQKSVMDASAATVLRAAEIWRSFKNSIGLSGSMNGALRGLGIVWPVLPLSLGALLAMVGTAATIVASVSGFITYLLTKTSRFQEYVNAGMDPVEAAEQARETAQAESGYSFGMTMQRVAMVGLGIALVVVLGPRLFPQK